MDGFHHRGRRVSGENQPFREHHGTERAFKSAMPLQGLRGTEDIRDGSARKRGLDQPLKEIAPSRVDRQHAFGHPAPGIDIRDRQGRPFHGLERFDETRAHQRQLPPILRRRGLTLGAHEAQAVEDLRQVLSRATHLDVGQDIGRHEPGEIPGAHFFQAGSQALPGTLEERRRRVLRFLYPLVDLDGLLDLPFLHFEVVSLVKVRFGSLCPGGQARKQQGH